MTTPTPLSAITSAHWQPALGREGAVVEGAADIDQAIRIILGTPRGSVPHLVRESVEALRRWEPGIDVLNVSAPIKAEQVLVKVRWQALPSVEPSLTEVSYARTA
ncbi:baseplate protein [Pseudomonas nicosulfuronedens]|uniref:baseplate protein n=1 Tax=Pseudomonas nicosulfuronedens TaxID=2571105 RepID=UPI002446C5B5|nr:baseplate protein [Pseudomonas nicosulfuronedens]MDH1012475.1 baseplate protein [Pseudomonas nicosulfuronedens]MDH1979980.1 baseplate protein [Pseudomonas nicosulfuronedens]MDH2029918.1 baseplate protein [Pseudomonas nicosulfuronedens]